MEIDYSKKAMKMARAFLEKHHHNVYDVHAILEGQTWKAVATVGFPNVQVKVVSIDARSGKILSCT